MPCAVSYAGVALKMEFLYQEKPPHRIESLKALRPRTDSEEGVIGDNRAPLPSAEVPERARGVDS